MSREIKFRCYCDRLKEMLDPCHVEVYRDGSWSACRDNGNSSLDSDWGLHLMQYTGMKDKNGKEIYEWDVVQRNEGGCYGRYVAKYKVIFIDACFCLVVLKSKVFKPDSILHTWGELEVIGNIYENKDLI